jgi:cytochrome c heme-lyase
VNLLSFQRFNHKMSGCPVDHTKFESNAPHPFNAKTAEACPVDHTKFDMSALSPDHPFYQHVQKHGPSQDQEPVEVINPRNMMPTLSQDPHPTQTVQLPTQRSISTIPKSASTDMDPEAYGDKEDKFWVYPSPQQFYNALKRKGWETPEDQVPVMVDIHNFLNEECWQEILKWEKMANWYALHDQVG